jgi:hypothetical protein
MLRANTTAATTLRVGQPIIVEGHAPTRELSCVFEDDGSTGYFYAVDDSAGRPIQDAVQIYKVDDVVDAEEFSQIEIAWSSSERACALLINGFVHAVFDFSARRGYARSGVPEAPATGWSPLGHAWSDVALTAFTSR